MRAEVVEDIYPLSPMQQGMLFHSVYAAGSGVYFEQMSCELRGELNLAAFERAWQEVVDRHAVLRSSFVWEELDEPVQVVERRVEMPVPVLDWRALSAREQAARLEEFLVADRGAGFDLQEPPLMRVTLMRLGAGRHRLVWSHHHLLLDGWSLPLLLREVFSLYEAHARGERPYLPPPRPFRDYIAWLRRQDAPRAERFWREYLRGFTSPTPLPLARVSSQPGGESPSRGHGERRASLSREATERLTRLARTHQLTLNTVVQGAWAVLLSRYSGEGDVVFGATVSGRPAELEGVERMLGLFINTLPVRARVRRGERVCDWLRGLQEEGAEARQYEYAPLSDVQRWGGVGGGRPLFDSIFVFENYPVDSDLGKGVSDGGASIEIGNVGSFKLTNYPLTVLAAVGDQLRLLLSYDQTLFADESAEQLLRHLVTLLEAMAENPEQRLAELSPLTDEERHRLVVECNDTARDYPAGQTVHGLFERQVRRTPDAPALTFGGETVSYAQLNGRANRLAHYLRRRGVGPESRVAVLMERSVELVVSLLAVLKAGGAYVPLDPEYPAERLRFMLDDCRPAALLTASALSAESAPEWGGTTLLLDAEAEAVAAEPGSDPGVRLDPQSLAYVIYTSGSTGRPKGAMNSHRAVVNRLLWMQDEYALWSSDAVLQKTPYSFDVSVWEFFWPLLAGARLVVARPGLHRDPAALSRLIVAEGVTTLHFVPSMLGAFLEEPASVGCAGVLRRVICSGEALGWGLRERFFGRLVGVGLHNLYGPTEAAVDVTAWRCGAGDPEGVVPIGRPVANTQVYVLDEGMGVAPAGVAGELYIGGVQVGRGYLNRPALTAERFVPDPFGEEPGGRLYRTGDIVRHRGGGWLEYLGRADHQVKLRGFRIELGEVEAVLCQHPGVRECVAEVREEGGHRRLVAYFVAVDAQEGPGVAELRGCLMERLPEHMVPSLFVELSELPLTPNGKVDRRALPAPDAARGDARRYVAPRTPEEELLCEVWREVLGVGRVGVEENFFELGGDSILSIQVVSRAARRGLRLTPRQLFQHQTVALLAAAAATQSVTPARSVGGAAFGDAPLTPIQRWFFEAVTGRREHWNQAVLLEVAAQGVDARAMGEALSEVMRRHPALRTRFDEGEGGRWSQHCPGEVEEPTPLTVADLSAVGRDSLPAEIGRAAAHAQSSLDIREGRMLRAVLFGCGEGEPARLLIVIHHLVVDGVSWRVLLEDWQAAYEQLRGGRAAAEVELAGEGTPFAEWARRLAEFARADEVQSELGYWLGVGGGGHGEVDGEGAAPGFALPVDFEDGANLERDTAHVTVSLTEDETRSLLREVPAAYHTEVNDALLCALGRALWRWSGDARPVVELEGHGREEFSEDLDVSRTVGWFTTIFPVVLEAGGGVGEDLKAVKERLRGVPRRGLGYGLLRHLGADEGARRRLAEQEGGVLFNYLGQLDGAVGGESLFRPARESSGAPRWYGGARTHLLSVNASVAGGRLSVSWGYGRKVHRKETVERAAGWMVGELRAIVAHCREEGAGGYTPSDFPAAALSQEELDDFIASVG